MKLHVIRRDLGNFIRHLVTLFRMEYKRRAGAAAFDPIWGMVVTGGDEGLGSSPLYTTERTNDANRFQEFTNLPYGVVNHCLVSLQNWGEMLLIGGSGGTHTNDGNQFRSVLKYHPGDHRWYPVADMPTPREGIQILPLILRLIKKWVKFSADICIDKLHK